MIQSGWYKGKHMLRIKVMLEPGGNQAATRQINEIEIANVTRSAGRISSDYIWRITSQDAKKPIQAVGYLVDSDNDTAIQLLFEVLAEWKSGRDLPIDNHGNMTRPEGIGLEANELWSRLDQIQSNPIKDE